MNWQFQSSCRLLVLVALSCVFPVPTPLLAQENPVFSNESNDLRESLPRIIYTLNEQGELVPFVEKFPWDSYNQLMDTTAAAQQPGCVATSLSIDVRAEDAHATARNSLTLKIIKDGQHRVAVGMARCHFLSQPRIGNDVQGASVFARYDEDEQRHEVVVHGKSGQVLEVEFTTQIALKKIGSRSFFRLNIPRFPASRMIVHTPATDVAAGVTDGMTVRPITTQSSPDSSEGTTFQVDGLLPRFEFWWQPKLESDDTESAFAVAGDIETTVNELGKVSSVATLNLTSYSKSVDGFIVQLPPNCRWSKNLPTDDYSLSVAETSDGRESLQVIFYQPSVTPPAVRIAVESQAQQAPNGEATKHDLAAFNVLKATTQYGIVRVYSEGDWTLDFTKGDFARETNLPTESATRTFAYSRLNQLSMTVTKQTPQLIVEPVYVVTLEETVAQLTALFRCTRRGTRQGDLSIELGDWIFQSVRSGSDVATIDNPELLSPTNGRLDIPVTSATDRFEVAITATRPIEDGLVVISDDLEENGPNAVSRLSLDFPVPVDGRLLHATVALQNEKSLSVSAGFTTAYSEIRVPEFLRSEVEPDLRPLCFRMRAAGRPATFPILAARLARSTTVDMTTEILNITPERIRIRQQMLWQVKGVPLNAALLSITRQVYEFGDLEIDVNGQPTVYNRTGTFDSLSGNDEVTIQVPIESHDLGSFELVVTYDWANWTIDGLETWEFLDSVYLDFALPQKPSLVAAAGQLTLRHGFRNARITGYEVSLDPIGNENINWAWEPQGSPAADMAFSGESINVIPLMIQRRATTEVQPEQFDELIDRAWIQTWCADTIRTDRAVFRVQGGDKELRVAIPDVETTSLTVWVDSKVTDFRNLADNLISIDLNPNQSSHVVELIYARPRKASGLLQARLPRIEDAELIGQWYWHVVLPRNECMVTWPRRLTRAHHWDWSSIVPRRKSELTVAELESWSGALPTRAKVHAGSSEYLFGIMGEPEVLSVRTAPLPLYMLTMTGLILVAGSLLFYVKRPTVVLLLLGTAILGGIYANPAFASVAGQFVVFGLVLVMLGQVLAWLLNHSPHVRHASGARSPSTWIHRLELPNQEKSGSSPATARVRASGSSSYRSVP